MRKTAAVILPTLAEQEEAGERLIDPANIDLTEWDDPEAKPRPVFAGGSYRVPEDVVGWWSHPRVEDGRLVVDVEIDEVKVDGEVRFSFAGITGGGQGRLISVHAHDDRPPDVPDRRIVREP